MTAEKRKRDIFRAKIVASKDVDGLQLVAYDNGLLHVKVPRYYSIDMAVFRKSQQYLRTLGPEKRYHFVFEFASFSDVDPEMRKQRATHQGTEFSLSDAIVISNLPQKMLGDFYLRFNKPVRPTKFFFSLDKAVEWSLQLRSDNIRSSRTQSI